MKSFVRVAGLPVVQSFHQLVVQIGRRDLEKHYPGTLGVPYLELR